VDYLPNSPLPSSKQDLESSFQIANRALRVLSACTQAVIRAVDERALLHTLCHLITEEAAYRMAWVGYVYHDPAKTVQPIAWAGYEADYLKTINLTWADTERGRGPTGQSIRLRQPIACQNMLEDPNFAPWRKAALQRGYQSSVVLPLWEGEEVFGTLNIYSAEADAFTHQEIELLTQLADSLGFGILTLRAKQTQQQAEVALRLSEDKFSKAFYSSPIANSIIVLEEGRVLDVNHGFEWLFGYDRQEVIGRTTLELQMWPKLEERQTMLQHLKTQGNLRNYEVTLQNHRREKILCRIAAEPLQVGDQLCILVAIEDITKRREAELKILQLNATLAQRVEERTTALRKSEQRYRALMDGASDAILLANVQGQLVEANRKALEMLGYTEAELLQMNAAQLHPPEDLARAMAAFAGMAQRQVERCSDVLVVRKDGHCFPADITGSLIDLEDETVLWGSFRDISDRKQVELELQRSNQELEQFAYAASHDLQEPLRAVTGYTQLLMAEYGDRFDDTAQSYAEYVIDGAKRMQQLIQDLLAYSRVGTRGKDFALTDCNAVVKEALRNLQIAIAESRAEIVVEPLPTLPADHTQLVQLYQNLIGNALKFCQQDHPCVHIRAIQREVDVLFQVEDNGIGIKPQYLDRIFEVFKRLHTRREYSGTGIGLALSKKIVLRHGGQIWAESTPNQGTTFCFTLPRPTHE
jgi:PAS domain S-box-containing protein